MISITPHQRETLAAIHHHIAEHGVAPSFRELMDATGISSLSLMSDRLNRLEARGHICRRYNKSRDLTPIIHTERGRFRFIPVP